MSNRILTLREMGADHLIDLAERRCAAIRIRNYYNPEIAKQIANKLCQSELFGKYENALKIGRAGQAYFEGLASKESARRYRAYAGAWANSLRNECNPYQLPVDRLRLEFDEKWPLGARLANLGGAKAFAGLVRVFEQGSGTEPHLDNLAWDLKDIDGLDTDVIKQFAVNIYLDPIVA